MRWADRTRRAEDSAVPARKELPIAMKNMLSKMLLIGALTLAGVVALAAYPLTLGIDLSGGTILVYEVDQASLPGGFKMDDLIAALKKRVNPEGVYDITIREIGGSRVEIILPKESGKPVDELKRELTDVGALEFRILASEKVARDRPAIKRATGRDGLTNPPAGYRWAKLGEVATGPTRSPTRGA
jgi:SecD/SecF fusion protein